MKTCLMSISRATFNEKNLGLVIDHKNRQNKSGTTIAQRLKLIGAMAKVFVDVNTSLNK